MQARANAHGRFPGLPGLIWIALLLLTQAAGGSPLFSGSATDVWVVDEEGTTRASYNVGAGDWTLGATVNGSGVEVDLEMGGVALLPLGIGAGEGVFVNQAAKSHPVIAAGLAGLSLKGLEAARSSFNDPMQPSVSIEPARRFHEETLRVRLVALPGDSNPEPVVIQWKVSHIDSTSGLPIVGPTQSLQAEETEFFLFEPGKHVVEYRVIQGSKLTAFALKEYEIDANLNRRRDTDGDGLPDAWEIENGLDPLSADAGQDRDGDGTSDFDEILRGTDPDDATDHPTNAANDPDCDGWSTWDEDKRGTDQDAPGIPVDLDGDNTYESCEPASPWPSRPVARRSAEVEYTLTGGAWLDIARATPKTGLGRLSVMDPYGEVLFDQAALPGLEEFVQAGWIAANLPDAQLPSAVAQAELQLPSWLRASEVAAPLSAGALPAVRIPGGNASIVRVRDEDAPGLPGLWVAKGWLAPSPDRTPAAYNEYVEAEIEAGNDISWITAADWQSGYEAYFSAGLLQSAPRHLDPTTGLALSLLEAAVSWHSEQSSGGASSRSFTLPIARAIPRNAVPSLALAAFAIASAAHRMGSSCSSLAPDCTHITSWARQCPACAISNE